MTISKDPTNDLFLEKMKKQKKQEILDKVKKKSSKIRTHAQIVRSNPDIFSTQYPRSNNENDSHYISKVYLGENLRRMIPKLHLLKYEYVELPRLSINEDETRDFQPDIYFEVYDHRNKKKKIMIIEINGGIHYKNESRIRKNKVRRESIIFYFSNDYVDRDTRYQDYETIFSYLVFEPDEFEYHLLDHFTDIVFHYLDHGGRYPITDIYEELMLR